MNSNQKCLYCKEIVYPGLDFQNDCMKEIREIGDRIAKNIPIRAKAKEFAGYQTSTYTKRDSYGANLGSRTVTYKTYRDTKEKVDKNKLTYQSGLKGPLCYDCMTKFLVQAITIFENVKTKGKKKSLDNSIEATVKKYLKLLLQWKKKI